MWAYRAEADEDVGAGGKMSHEYLFPSPNGEDSIANCGGCGYTANVETVVPKLAVSLLPVTSGEVAVHHSISKDRLTLVNTYYIKFTRTLADDEILNEVNLQKVKALVPDIDSSVGPCVELFEQKFVPYEYGSRTRIT